MGGGEEVDCPSCGRPIAVDAFKAHVVAERERLQEVIGIFETRRTAIATLCDTVKSLMANLSKDDVKSWRDAIGKTVLAGNLAYLATVDT